MSILSNCSTGSCNVVSSFETIVKRSSRAAGFLVFCGLFLSAVSLSVFAGPANQGIRTASAGSNMDLPVLVTAPVATHPTISTFVVPISVNNITGENIIAFQFNIIYDPLVINPFGPNFGCSTTGTLAGNAGQGPTCNVIMGEEGRLRISVSGASAMTGMGTVLNLTFKTTMGAMAGQFSPFNFEPGTLFFFRGGPMAGPVPVTPTNGQINLIGPSSATASIAGRVTASDGRGVQNAVMTISGGNLSSPRTARTASLGYFSVDGLDVGQTYVVTVNSKRFAFAMPSRVISLTDSVSNADFVADPE